MDTATATARLAEAASVWCVKLPTAQVAELFNLPWSKHTKARP